MWVQPGKRQPTSRACSARRIAAGIVRKRRPIDSGSPLARSYSITTAASQLRRRAVVIEMAVAPAMYADDSAESCKTSASPFASDSAESCSARISTPRADSAESCCPCLSTQRNDSAESSHVLESITDSDSAESLSDPSTFVQQEGIGRAQPRPHPRLDKPVDDGSAVYRKKLF